MDDVQKAEKLAEAAEEKGFKGPARLSPVGRRTRKGRLNQKTLVKLDTLYKELASGKMPLDVMLEQMRFAQDQSAEITKEFIERLGKGLPRNDPKAMVACLEQVNALFEKLHQWRVTALDAATRAAPYCHPKLNAIAMKISDPEGTRSIVDVNLIAATGAAVSDILNEGIQSGEVTLNGTTPNEHSPHNGTTPPERSNNVEDAEFTEDDPQTADDSVLSSDDSVDIPAESGETPVSATELPDRG